VNLSIVIVSVDHAHFLRPCLAALRRGLTGIEAEVFVVDNQCEDDSAAVTRELLPEATLVLAPARTGFSRANNLALRQATGRYLLLLNPDTEVRPGALATLVAYLDAHPAVGAAGPQLLNPDGSLQHSCRAFPSLRSVFFRWLPFGPQALKDRALRRYLALDCDHASAQPVDWVMGACLCVRRSAAEEVGWLDEGFQLYYEDIDWCYRMWRAGWEVHYVPEAQVVHQYQRTSARHVFNRATAIHLRSVIRFFLKHRLLRL
jgi:N-acetylglucosaminyl-diphospho-decaprenol L-rhamnosyltransferase